MDNDQDSVMGDSTAQVTRDMRKKLVITEDDAQGDVDMSMDDDSAEAQPSLTSKLLANPDDEDKDEDDVDYVYKEQNSKATDASDDEEEELDPDAISKELADIRAEANANNDGTRRAVKHLDMVDDVEEDEASFTDGESMDDTSDGESEEPTGPNSTLLKLMQGKDLSGDEESDDDDFKP